MSQALENLTLWLQSLPFTFLPGLLLLLLAPLAFLVLLLRRQRLDVGSLLLFRDLPQRTLFQNINLEHLWHRWIYAFIFAVLALIAAGLSLPQPGQRHVIVIDDSASMAAWVNPQEREQGRVWDEAKSSAKSIAEQSSALGRAVVILRLTDLSPISEGSGDFSNIEAILDANDLQQQLAGLEAAELSVLPLSLEERLQSLGSLAGGQGIGRISVITDRPLDEDASFESQVEWVDVGQGTVPINLAIVGVQEKQNTFDRDTRVVIQNLSLVPVSNAQLSMRSIKNPVSLPLINGLTLAPNERIELEIDTLRDRAEVLGSGPLLLSVEHPADALDIDNSLWTVRPTNEQLTVALVRCLGSSPLFDRLEGASDIRFSYFGDMTALDESLSAVDPLDEEEAPVEDLFALGGEIDAAGGQFESFDLVIYDRCELPPLYEELETNGIVVEAVINTGSDPNAIDEAAAAAVVRVGWQAPNSRSPVLEGVRSLVGMPMPSQSVRPLPQTHSVVGLFSDLDPSMVAGTADRDFFAPTDLLQGFVAFDGLMTKYDPEMDTETASPRDPLAPKMLYIGFDPHVACLDDVVNDSAADFPLAEALAASQNGPDDCLAMGLMMVNTLEWMRASSLADDNSAARVQRVRQYFSTGESLNVQSAAADDEAVGPRERLFDVAITPGQAGSDRTELSPLAVSGLSEASGDQDRVRWLLSNPGLREYSGTRQPFQLSVGLLNADESRMSREPFAGAIDVRGASASAGRQDLVRLMVFVLLGLMAIEMLILLFRGRGVFVRRSVLNVSPAAKAGNGS